MTTRFPEQRLLAATLYPLIGLQEVEYKFRVLKIRESIPQDNNQPIRLQKWADRIWRQELKCPTYPTQRFGFPGFLIPEGNSPAIGTTVEIRDVPDRTYHIDVTDQVISINIDEASRTERELICRMLERPFSDQFNLLKHRFWRVHWSLYHKLLAENDNKPDDVINAYRGLKFGVVFLEERGLYLAADIKTRYISRKSLAEYTTPEKEGILKEHLDETQFDNRGFFLRDNGSVKIHCRFAGSSSKTISEYSFNAADGQQYTIYEYYRERYLNLDVDPNEEAVFVKDRSSQNAIAVPISRLFPIFTTEHDGVKKCSVRPYLSPSERVNVIEPFLDALSGLEYANSPIVIEKGYLTAKRTIFTPPSLEYRDGKLLEPFSNSSVPNKSNSRFNQGITRWASQKLPFLYEACSYSDLPLPSAVLLIPENIKRSEREAFVEKLQDEIKKQTGEQLQFIKQESFSINMSQRRGDSLLELAQDVREKYPDSLVVVVLWEKFSRHVYTDLKDTLELSQCVTEQVFRSILDDSSSRLSSGKLCKLALGVLIEAGIQPWVLANDLHHDLHIGIDVLDGKVVYHFLYGKGGRRVRREFGKSSSNVGKREAIKRFELKKVLERVIRSIVQEGYPLRNLIIHRDGRWWSSEKEGLAEAIQKLQEDESLPSAFEYAVVEIRKNHLPVRLFADITQGSRKILENPLPGTFLILNSTRVILTTTGKSSWDRQGRTAGNLLLEVVDSNTELSIKSIAEDAFWLTHLNWDAPDIEIGLPVTIHWSDQALRETFYSSVGEIEEEELEDDASDK